MRKPDHTHVAEYGRINTLINNAGISMWSRLEDVQDPVTLNKSCASTSSAACTAPTMPYRI
ncbi:MAG: hypothetical protein R3C44_13500 [Chloroflexota bacterium]